MLSKPKRSISCLLCVVFVLTNIFSGYPLRWMTAKGASEYTYQEESDIHSVKGIMDSYGHVVFTNLRMNAHQHSNIITGEYTGQEHEMNQNTSECTIRPYYNYNNETFTNYVRKFTHLEGDVIKFGNVGDTLVIGEEYTIGTTDHGAHYTVNDHKVENSSTVTQDTETERTVQPPACGDDSGRRVERGQSDGQQ